MKTISIESRIKKSDVDIREIPFEIQDKAFCLKYNNRNYIFMNSNAPIDDVEKYWIISHELSHIESSTLYSIDASDFVVNYREEITNQDMIVKSGLILDFIALKETNESSSKIIKELGLTQDVYEHFDNYIKKVGLIDLKNVVNLLCLKNNITIDELTLRLGCSRDTTLKILKEEMIIPYDMVLRLCDIFNVTQDYILVGNNR